MWRGRVTDVSELSCGTLNGEEEAEGEPEAAKREGAEGLRRSLEEGRPWAEGQRRDVRAALVVANVSGKEK